MKLSEVVSRVLGEAGATPVRTRLTPSEVAERARRQRRRLVVTRSLTAAGATVVVVGAAIAVPTVMRGTQPQHMSSAAGNAAASSGSASVRPMMTSLPKGTRLGDGSGEAHSGAGGAGGQGSAGEHAATPTSTRRASTAASEQSSTPDSTAANTASAPAAPAWGTGPKSGQGSATSGGTVVRRIRVGRHERFDRVVFDFPSADDVPDYQVHYVKKGRRLKAPGSGRPVDLPGDRVLEVEFHADKIIKGDAGAVKTPELPAVRQARNVSGFEGRWTAAVGVSNGDGSSPPDFRVKVVGDRIAIDVAHP